jgi:hypothetical protein
MELVIHPDGSARCIYSEEIELAALGPLAIARASHVEPTERGQWITDLSPVNGPTLGPFDLRSEALAAELTWLRTYWLASVH